MRSDLLRTPTALPPPLQTMSNPVPGTASESAAVLGVAPASIMVKRADVVAVSSSTRMVIPLRLVESARGASRWQGRTTSTLLAASAECCLVQAVLGVERPGNGFEADVQ